MTQTSVLVCDSDPMARRALCSVIDAHGWSVVGETSTALGAVQIAKHVPDAVVVIENDLMGLTGLEVTPELIASGHKVIFVSQDPRARRDAAAAGAFATLARGDLGAFDQALNTFDHFDQSGDHRTGTTRRIREDRRKIQDWNAVTSERRVSARRVGERRVDERRSDERRLTPQLGDDVQGDEREALTAASFKAAG
ncbi:MAG: hypothetical protein WCK41_08185 [Actinomycetes bacterium]